MTTGRNSSRRHHGWMECGRGHADVRLHRSNYPFLLTRRNSSLPSARTMASIPSDQESRLLTPGDRFTMKLLGSSFSGAAQLRDSTFGDDHDPGKLEHLPWQRQQRHWRSERQCHIWKPDREPSPSTSAVRPRAQGTWSSSKANRGGQAPWTLTAGSRRRLRVPASASLDAGLRRAATASPPTTPATPTTPASSDTTHRRVLRRDDRGQHRRRPPRTPANPQHSPRVSGEQQTVPW